MDGNRMKCDSILDDLLINTRNYYSGGNYDRNQRGQIIRVKYVNSFVRSE